MKNLKLTAAEADRLVDDDDEGEEKQFWALAGKILVPEPKVFTINTISDALRPVWGNPKGLFFRDGGNNLFIAELSSERDRDRIWERSPWTVSKFAVVLENFNQWSRPSELHFDKLLIWIRVLDLPYNKLNPEWGEKIAKRVGDFVKLDKNKDGLISAQYIRARVFIKVNEPIMRWVGLDSKRLEKTFWYSIQYEFLPYFCFSCGLLGHSDAFCPTPSERDEEGNLPWGSSLRAPNDKKKKNRGPPFAEGSYEEFPDYYEDPSEADLESDGKASALPPKFNSGGRGRGRGFGYNGGRSGQSQVYRKLFPPAVDSVVGEKTNDQATGKDLVMYDPQISGSKREEAELRKIKEGLTPDAKKQRSTSNTSTSALAGLQQRREQ